VETIDNIIYYIFVLLKHILEDNHVKRQSPMQSCRSLQPLPISDTVSKVVH